MAEVDVKSLAKEFVEIIAFLLVAGVGIKLVEFALAVLSL